MRGNRRAISPWWEITTISCLLSSQSKTICPSAGFVRFGNGKNCSSCKRGNVAFRNPQNDHSALAAYQRSDVVAFDYAHKIVGSKKIENNDWHFVVHAQRKARRIQDLQLVDE